MTISTTASRISYNGNGVTVAFSFPYRFLANRDIVVVLRSATGSESILLLDTHYTLSGAGADTGGTVTMAVAPAVGERLVIYRSVAITQETDYISGDPFPAETHERALDRAAMIDQQQQDSIDRTLRFPVSDTVSPDLPTQAVRANKLLAFDALGNPTTAVPVIDSSTDVRLDLSASTGAAMVGAEDGEGGALFTQLQQAIDRIEWATQAAPHGINVLRYVPPAQWPAIIAGTSTYDAAPAIQSAITSLGVDGGGIYVPRGQFTVAQQINIPLAVWKPVVIRGAGNTIIRSTHNGIVINDSTGNIRLENLRFHGPGLDNINSKAIVSILSQGYVKGCYFKDYRVAIDITASSGALIERCQFSLCQEGIRSVSVSPAFSNFAMVRSCWFDFCTYGCYFEEMYGLVLDNNAFEYNSVGVYANNVRLANLRGSNWFELNTVNAFQIYGSSTGEIGKENRIVGAGYIIDYANSRLLDYLTPSICILAKNVNQLVAHNTAINITWQVEKLDPSGMHSVDVDADQIVIKTTGVYEIVGSYEFAASAAPGTSNTVFSQIALNKNGSVIKQVKVPMLNNSSSQLCISTIESLSFGDVLRVQAYQNTGGSLNIQGNSFAQVSIRLLSTD